MRFSEIICNEELKQRLMQMVDRDMLPHAIMFSEKSSGGALALALALAQYVNCRHHTDNDSCGEWPSCHKYRKLIHPDLYFVFPVNASKDISETEKKRPISDYFLPIWRHLVMSNPYFGEQELYDAIGLDNKTGNISVYEAKRLIEKLALRSFEGEYKTVIIFLAEKMNQEAANKLLKLLEEPPQGTLFLLITQAPEKILPTIISRCQLIQVPPISKEESKSKPITNENSMYSEVVVGLLKAGLGKNLLATFPVWESLSELGREKQREFCIYTENYIRNIYMVANGLPQIADINPNNEVIIGEFAQRIKPSFYEKGINALDQAMTAIDSNVNSKLIFCDLCNRLLLSL